MKLLNCGRTKVSEYFNELDEPRGVGLIERRQKVGIGKSDRIYVKNFAKPLDNTCRDYPIFLETMSIICFERISPIPFIY